MLKYKIGCGNKTKITFRLNKNSPISSSIVLRLKNRAYAKLLRFVHLRIMKSTSLGLTVAGENIPTNLDTILPLCKRDYHVVYTTYKPKQTHCPTRGTGLHKQNARACPNVTNISIYLAKKTQKGH